MNQTSELVVEKTEKPTIAFLPAEDNLAEVTRCLYIADICRDRFGIVFLSYGGVFKPLVERAGYDCLKLEPQNTPEQALHVHKVSQGRKLSVLFNRREISQRVSSEAAAFTKLRPVAVVTGGMVSPNLSCRVAGVPLVWISQSTWLFERGLADGALSYPDLLHLPILRLLGERCLRRLTVPFYNVLARNFAFRDYNKVAHRLGLPGVWRMEEIWYGDYNLLAEPRGFSGIEVPDNYHFIGPIITRLDTPVPAEIAEIRHDLPILYLAMGSSGDPEVITKIIGYLAGQPYRVITPTQALLKARKLDIPPNVTVTDWLPAHVVNGLADLSIIHGGIGTVMTAALAGKPVIGIGMMPEQEGNLDCLVRKGCALRIRRGSLNAKTLLGAIETMVADERAKEKAAELQAMVEEWDRRGPSLVAAFFERFLPGQS